MRRLTLRENRFIHCWSVPGQKLLSLCLVLLCFTSQINAQSNPPRHVESQTSENSQANQQGKTQVDTQGNVFGPEKFGTSPSVKDFKVAAPSGAFDLILEAATETDQPEQFIKAIVKLNGEEVVGANDSNQTRIVKRVRLKQENVISVESASLVVLTIAPSPILTIYTNPQEPLFLRQQFSDGRTLDYFGTKKSNGDVTAITSASLRDREGKVTTYKFDKKSRITEIKNPNGVKYEFEWLSDSAAKVSLTSPDGEARVTAPVDFSTLPAARLVKGGANCPGCLNSSVLYAKNSQRKNNNHASASLVGAQEVCSTIFSAVNNTCKVIRTGLGLPGAKRLVCGALAAAVAASGYGVALLPFLTGGGCETVLTGVQLLCGVVGAINAYDQGAGLCSSISSVVTKVERFVLGPKRGSTLKSLTEDSGKKKIPLILVHGIHGSDDLSEITYDSPYWRNFIGRFKANAALMSAYALYTFQYYSDSEGVQDLATHLGNYIDAQLPDRPHVLLAHSMGGLVSKSYMVDFTHRQGAWAGRKGGDTTLLLITLATPHHGSPAANDAGAIKQYMAAGWYRVFTVANFAYWTMNAGIFSNPSFNSGTYNRSDLRWDNYDGAISTDLNLWLGPANRRFDAYKSKVIAYGGVLNNSIILTAAQAYAAATLGFVNDHRKLELLNVSLFYGLGRKFGGTDGMVPYESALLCDKGPFLIDASNTSFICSSPTRVRRFEPGNVSVNTPNQLTLSITRNYRGYDHEDMRDSKDVLDWVVIDLLGILPRPVVSTSLTLSQPPAGGYHTGEAISGTYTITNRGTADLTMNHTLISGRLAGTCPNNRCPDFGPAPGPITLKPNQTYSYSGTFTPTRPGTYNFSVAYENTDGKWIIPVAAENGNANHKDITVVSLVPNVVVSKSLTLTPGNGPLPLGQAVNGTFSITNRGAAALTMRQVLIAGRLSDTCPNNVCPDFSPINANITLNPGQTYNYAGRINLNQAGPYTFSVAYQSMDNKWELPVKSENGTINKLSIIVQGPLPTLTRRSPDSLLANATLQQSVDLYGTKLRTIVYCSLRFPNGQGSFLYMPLNQVFAVSDTQIRIKTKFLSPGTYYVTAWTLDGKSNEFPIVVR